jgi:hypothetical protein
VACAQSTLPPMNPTMAERAPHLASISFADGQLAVSADNSSLNQILRDVARRTGIKITGRVIDQQVFGTYGPAAPAKVLETLLDGSESNMIFIRVSADTHQDLILTPRQGGPTPPNPNALAFSDEARSTENAESSSIFQQASVDPPSPPSGMQHPIDSIDATGPGANSEGAETKTAAPPESRAPAEETPLTKSTVNTQ